MWGGFVWLRIGTSGTDAVCAHCGIVTQKHTTHILAAMTGAQDGRC
jgi:hypothetical protein